MEKLDIALRTIAAPLGRILLSFIFIMAGWSKIGAYAGTVGYMESLGVPGALLPLVIALELGAGIALLVGYQARVAAVLLGGFAIVSGVLFHLLPSFGMEGMAAQGEFISFMKNLAIAGGMGFVFIHGAGALSVDQLLARGSAKGYATA